MGYPKHDAGDFLLDVDASGVGIGGVLAQLQDGRERVIAYASRRLNKAEKNYCVTEKELLAVIYFVQYFRQYLLGRKFSIRTDHQALVWLLRLKEPNGKIARWIEILSAYPFEIEYRPGKQQGHCDALSRCLTPKECACANVDMMEPLKCGPCNKCRRKADAMMLDNVGSTNGAEPTGAEQEEAVSKQSMTEAIRTAKIAGKPGDVNCESPCLQIMTSHEMEALQKGDPNIGTMYAAIQNGVKPGKEQMLDESPETRHYYLIWDSLEMYNGLLFRKFTSVKSEEVRYSKYTPSPVHVLRCHSGLFKHCCKENIIDAL